MLGNSTGTGTGTIGSGSVRAKMRLVVQLIGQDGLRVVDVFEVDALVVHAALVVHRIGAVKHDKARLLQWLHLLQHVTQRQAFPLADGAPALDAIVARICVRAGMA